MDEIAVLRRSEDDGTARKLGADLVFTQLSEAIAFSPDWSIIATPATMHVESAIALANAGSGLLVEKPLAASVQEARMLVEWCQQRNHTLMTGYNLRFDPTLQALQRSITDGKIGCVLGIEASVGQYLPDWRPGVDYRKSVSARRSLGGGALLELSHELDYVNWIGGGKMQVVGAQLKKTGALQIDVEDWVDLHLQDPSGVLASIHLDFLSRVPHRVCRVTGAEGSLVWDGIGRTTTCLTVGSEEIVSQASGDDRNESYLAMARHFLSCVYGDSPPLVDGSQGLGVIEMVEAARQMNDTLSQAA